MTMGIEPLPGARSFIEMLYLISFFNAHRYGRVKSKAERFIRRRRRDSSISPGLLAWNSYTDATCVPDGFLKTGRGCRVASRRLCQSLVGTRIPTSGSGSGSVSVSASGLVRVDTPVLRTEPSLSSFCPLSHLNVIFYTSSQNVYLVRYYRSWFSI